MYNEFVKKEQLVNSEYLDSINEEYKKALEEEYNKKVIKGKMEIENEEKQNYYTKLKGESYMEKNKGVKKDKLDKVIEYYEKFNKEYQKPDNMNKKEYEEEMSYVKADLIRKEKAELKKTENEVLKVKRQLKRKIDNEILACTEMQGKNRGDSKKIEEKIEKLKKQYEITNKKIDNVLLKHENRMFDKLNELGITDEEMGIERKTDKEGKISVTKNDNNTLRKIGILISSKVKKFKDKKVFKNNKEKGLKRILNKVRTLRKAKSKETEEIDPQDLEQKIINQTEVQLEEKEKVENEKELENEKKVEETEQEKIKQEPKNETKNNETKKPTVKFNIKTGTYTLIDEAGFKYERDIEPRLLTKKAKNAFAIELLEKYFKKPDKEDIEIAKDVSKKADINLYTLYESYDKENGTDFAREYMSSIYDMDRDQMPTDVTYDLVEKNKEKNVKLSWKDKMSIKKMAKEHSKDMKIADINEMKLWKKIAIGLGLAGGITALGTGSAKLINEVAVNQDNNKKQEKEVVNWEDIQPNNKIEKASIRETLKVDLSQITHEKENNETLNKDINSIEKQEEIKVGVGSKAILDEGTYYYSSEFATPTGKMENREDKLVEIEYIAAVGEDGNYKCCAIDGDIEKVRKEYPDAKIVVSIKNSTYDLGWMAYEGEVKEAFEKYAMEELEKQNGNIQKEER